MSKRLILAATLLFTFSFPFFIGSSEAAKPVPKQCADRRDNDSDGRIDYPADRGCTNKKDNSENTDNPPPPAACADGLDNDADGRVDYPADPGCSNLSDTTESPDPPPPPQCSDGLDNDGDGKIDFPVDPGCTSASDTTESPDPPPPPTDHQPIASYTYSPSNPVENSPVTFDGSSTLCEDAPCTYRWEDDGPDGPGGTQWPLGNGQTLQFTFVDCPCTIYARLIVTDVDGDTSTVVKTIQVADVPPAPVACSDGIDNDADSKIDYPADPGCTSLADTDETDPPPPPPAACGDGLDNDSDGKIDYPDDPGCVSVTDTDEFDSTTPPPPGTSRANEWVVPNAAMLSSFSAQRKTLNSTELIDDMSPYKKVVGYVAGTVAAVAVGIGVWQTNNDPPSEDDSGNVAAAWTSTTAQTCARSNPPVTYTEAKAAGRLCADFSDAMAVMSAGDLALARCDTGTSCTIASSGDTIAGDKGGFVTFREDTGYNVSVGAWCGGDGCNKLSISGNNIQFEGMYVYDTALTGNDIVYRNNSGSSVTASGDDIGIIGGDWTYLACDGDGDGPEASDPIHVISQQDFIIRGVSIHDGDNTGCADGAEPLHLDCMHLQSSQSILVERNKFWECGSDGIIYGDGTSTPGVATLNNLTIQNNWFGQTDQQQINMTNNNNGTWCSNPLIRNNTMYKDVAATNYGPGTMHCRIDGSTTLAVPFRNNIIEELHNFFCNSVSWQYNIDMENPGLWSGSECGTGAANSTTAALAFTNFTGNNLASPNDWHIGSSSSARGFADAACPYTDIDGNARDDGDCDAGADEYDATPTPGPTWFVDDAGSDGELCTEFFPCLTLDRAYDLAAPGDVIGLMSGTYANQTVTGDNFKTSTTDIVIKPVAGATVTIPTLTLNNAKHLTVQDINTTRWTITGGSQDLTMKNINTDVFDIPKGLDILVQGGDVGPYDAGTAGGLEDTQIGGGFNTPAGCASSNPTTGNGTTCTQDIINLTIDGVYFHDFTDVADPDAHIDCLQFFEGQNVVIRNNKFDNNCGESNDLFIRGDAGPIDGFLIENNWSERTANDFSFRLSGNSCPGSPSSCEPPCTNVTIRNNTVKQEIGANCTTTSGTIRGNVNLSTSAYICDSNDNDPQGKYGTEAGWVYAYNVVGVGGVKCNASDIQSDVSFVSSTDLHLTGAAAGADNVVPSPYASVDIDGEARPANSQADAGADERNVTPLGGANLWVDTNGGTCTRQATAAAYVDAAACGSFQAAYNAASGGDRVAIRSGTYGPQTITDRAIGTSVVTFCVDEGQSVAVNGGTDGGDQAITISADYVLLSGAYCGDEGTQQTDHIVTEDNKAGIAIEMSQGAGDRFVTVDNVHVPTAFINAWKTTLQYSEVGPAPDAICSDGGPDDLIQVWWFGTDETNPNQNTSILYNYIHDDLCNRSGAHVDGIQAQAGNLLVEGNRISTCGQSYTLSVANPPGGWDDFDGNVLRNNMIDGHQTGGSNIDCDVQIVSSGPDMTVEYNTIEGWFKLSGAQDEGGDVVRGNVFLDWDTCGGADGICEYNVFTEGSGDGTNSKVCTPKLASGSNYTNVDDNDADFYIHATDTCTAGAGSSANHPSTDIDGDTRASTPDAGADEVN